MPLEDNNPITKETAARSTIWLADFMQEDSDNIVVRRFERLRILQMLSIQDDLIHWSVSLSALRKSGQDEGLTEAFAKLRTLLPEYDNAINAYQRMKELREMPLYVRKVLEAKSAGGIIPALAEKYDPDDGWGDLIAVPAATKSPLHGMVDGNIKLQRIFQMKNNNNESSQCERGRGDRSRSAKQEEFFYYSEHKVRVAEQCLLYAMVFCLLLAPIVALPFLTSKGVKLGLVVGCVVLASVVSLLLPDQSPTQNFKLSIGYAAVLVAFLNNGTSS